MENFPNKKDRQIVLFSWLFFFVLTSFDFIVLIAFQNFYSISSFILLAAITIYLSHLVKVVSKNFKLKYYYQKKKYKELLNESIKKFVGADEDFIKELKKRTYVSFCCDGVLYYIPTFEETKWLYRSDENKTGFLILVNLLIQSIDNKEGFVFFINQAKTLTNNPYLNFVTLYNDFLSGEIRYLICMVYDLSDFDLTDNRMSLDYSTKLKKTIDTINNVYTPLLLNFKDELLNVQEYFKDSTNNVC